MTQVTPYTPENKIRIVTAASLFDGHDAAINIMRCILQAPAPRLSPGAQSQPAGNGDHGLIQRHLCYTSRMNSLQQTERLLSMSRAEKAQVLQCDGWSALPDCYLCANENSPLPVVEYLRQMGLR